MPKNALVTLRYGPYRSCGVVEHRAFRLQGLQAVLKEDGHEVVLEETPDWNDVQLIVNGETVFQCNINDLDFVDDLLSDGPLAMVLLLGNHVDSLYIVESLYNHVPSTLWSHTVHMCQGGDGKLDPLCEEARRAVLNAY